MDMLRAALLGGLIASTTACEKPAPVTVITPVQVATVEDASGGDGLVYSAQIEPDATIDLAFRTDGYVTSIGERSGAGGQMRLLQTGDRIKKGEVLAQIERGQYDDKVQTAQANLAKAQAAVHKADQDYKRAVALQATNSITGPDYDSAEDEYQTAQAAQKAALAQLDQAKLKLGDTSLIAPQDGTVLQRNIEIGSLVHSNSVGIVMGKTDTVKAIFGLPDVILKAVAIGEPLELTTAAYGERIFRGIVTEIAEAADQRSHLFNVTLSVDNSDGSLRPGMVAALDLNAKNIASTIVAIPLKAIVDDGDNKFAVFTISRNGDKTIAKRQAVTTGQVLGNNIVVSSGVVAGDEVIVTGTSQVQDQQIVNIIP